MVRGHVGGIAKDISGTDHLALGFVERCPMCRCASLYSLFRLLLFGVYTENRPGAGNAQARRHLVGCRPRRWDKQS